MCPWFDSEYHHLKAPEVSGAFFMSFCCIMILCPWFVPIAIGTEYHHLKAPEISGAFLWIFVRIMILYPWFVPKAIGAEYQNKMD